MAYLYENLSLVAKHVPDFSMEDDSSGNKVRLELPGHVEFGIVVDGAFVPIAKMGKARLDKHIARAKALQSQRAETPPPEQA